MKKIYVVTLYSGENEISLCKQSVCEQTGVEITHEIIAFLPKKEAHQRLFRQFEERRQDFDFMAKLDADMVFSNSNSMSSILDFFSTDVDIVSITVWDRITNSDIPSFNIFTRRCSFDYKNNDDLFTDKLPITYPGKHLVLRDERRNVHHAPEPTPYQAYMFGVHRALKVMQYSQHTPRLEAAYYQLGYIMKAYANFTKTGDTAAEMASLGAAQVLRGEIIDAALVDKTGYSDNFNAATQTSNFSPLKKMATRAFPMQMIGLWGLVKLVRSSFSYARRKLLATQE